MNFYSPHKKPNFLKSRETEKKTMNSKCRTVDYAIASNNATKFEKKKYNMFIRSNAAYNKIIYAQFFENQIFFTIQSVYPHIFSCRALLLIFNIDKLNKKTKGAINTVILNRIE